MRAVTALRENAELLRALADVAKAAKGENEDALDDALARLEAIKL